MVAAMPREERSSGSRRGNQGRTRGVCIRREPGVWRLAPGRHKRLDAHAVDTCASLRTGSRPGQGRPRVEGGARSCGAASRFRVARLAGRAGRTCAQSSDFVPQWFSCKEVLLAFKEREAGVGRADEQQLVGGGGGCGCEATWDGRRARSENRVRAGGEDAGRGLGRGPGLPFVICLVGA